MREVVESTSIKREKELPPLFFLGTLLVVVGVGLYFFSIVFSVFRLLFQLGEPFRSWNMAILWYSGVPSTLGVGLAGVDLAPLLPSNRRSCRRTVPVGE